MQTMEMGTTRVRRWLMSRASRLIGDIRNVYSCQHAVIYGNRTYRINCTIVYACALVDVGRIPARMNALINSAINEWYHLGGFQQMLGSICSFKSREPRDVKVQCMNRGYVKALASYHHPCRDRIRFKPGRWLHWPTEEHAGIRA
jgi:hypothetical protein